MKSSHVLLFSCFFLMLVALPWGCTDAEEPAAAATSSASGCGADCGGQGGAGGLPEGCGDAVCDADETCSSCEIDCGSCACGDGTCAATELCGTCALDCGECSGPPIEVVRGPYLQSGATDQVTLRWRTEDPSGSVVAYGLSPVALTQVASGMPDTAEHEVTLTGLSPDTKYFYAFGTPESALEGGDSDHSVLTSPPTGTARATRIWVIGDSGTANDNAAAVRDAYLAFTGTRGTDLWLMLGDNAYNDGTDAEYQEAVFDMYPSILRSSVLWATLGNHDGHSADSGAQSGPYYDIFTLPRQAEAGGVPSGTEAYYSFDYGNIHFVCLDSYDSDRDADGDMLTWLENDLAANQQTWLIAFWHHPPYTKGSHDSDSEGGLVDMRENALPILESYGVDLVLGGHSHSYERSFYLNGHYDTSNTFGSGMLVDGGDGRTDGDGAYTRAPSSSDGAVYVVAGSSGKVSGGSLDHPAMFASLDELGSMVLDLDGGSLNATFLDDQGNVADWFSIQKQ